MKFGYPIEPMLLSETDTPFDSERYIYEVKFDGYRATIHVSPDTFYIYSRNGKDLTKLYPELKTIQKNIKNKMIFDGEIVCFEEGVPSFSKLQSRSHLKSELKIKQQMEENPVCFVAFDCIYNNEDITSLSLLKRKEILDNIQETDNFIKTHYIFQEGTRLFTNVKNANLEGIVAKKIDSFYTIRTRTEDWIKIKNIKDGKFLICGYKEEIDGKTTLLLGEKLEKKLCYVGSVTIGKRRNILTKVKQAIKRKTSPFSEYKDSESIYIKEPLECEISYLERTNNNHLRHPSLKSF